MLTEADHFNSSTSASEPSEYMHASLYLYLQQMVPLQIILRFQLMQFKKVL